MDLVCITKQTYVVDKGQNVALLSNNVSLGKLLYSPSLVTLLHSSRLIKNVTMASHSF